MYIFLLFIKIFLFAGSIAGALAAESPAVNFRLTPASLVELYPSSGKKVELNFYPVVNDGGNEKRILTPLQTGSKKIPSKLSVELLDYTGKLTGRGMLLWEPDGRKYQFSQVFSSGFHELNIPALKQRIGIFAHQEKLTESDSFFGLETLIARQPEKEIREVLSILVRFGIRHIREYHSWEWEERHPGHWKGYAETIYGLAPEYGCSVTFFTAGIPPFLRTSAPQERFVTELNAMKHGLTAMCASRAKALDAIQINNEPDSRPVPGNAIMAEIQAASCFIRETNPELPIIGPAFSGWNYSDDLLAPYFKNGYLDTVDAIAIHTYKAPESVAGDIAFLHRQFRKASWNTPVPIWVTEAGKPWSRGIVTSQNGGKPGKLRAGHEEDALSAAFICMKAVEFKAAGAARYYPFTYSFFTENQNNFGMTDYYHTPMRQFAAYCYMAVRLAGTHYRGIWPNVPHGVLLNRVFSRNNNWTAVFYTGKISSVSLNLAGIPYRAVHGADGRRLTVDASRRVVIDDGFCFVELEPEQIPSSLRNTVPVRPPQTVPHPEKRKTGLFRFPHWNAGEQNAFFYFESPEILTIEAWNFGDTPLTFQPELRLPSGGKIVGRPRDGEFQVAAHSSRNWSWKLDLSDCEARREICVYDKKGLAHPLWLPFYSVDKLSSRSFELNDVQRWRANSNGEMTITQDTGGGIIFKTRFRDKGGWSYPEYVLKLPDESMEHAMAISFEVKARQSGNEPKFGSPGIMLSNAENVWKLQPLKQSPTSEWRSETIFLPEAMNKKEAVLIRFGMSGFGQELEFGVRNIRVYFKQENL